MFAKANCDLGIKSLTGYNFLIIVLKKTIIIKSINKFFASIGKIFIFLFLIINDE